LSEFFIESKYKDKSGKESLCYLLTKKGCDMVAHKMTGEKGVLFTATYVTKFEEMENSLKAVSSPKEGNMKIISLLHAELGEIIAATSEIDTRVKKLEDNMTIDYSQQEELREIVNKVIVNILVYGSPAYKELNKKAYSAIWRDYKRVMGVNSYRNTAVTDLDKARNYLINWKPDRELELMIKGANSQITMADSEVAATC
jgi:hypothetical protein